MNYKILTLTIISVFICSCNGKVKEYYRLSYSESTSKLIINGNITNNKLENGDWTFCNSAKKMISKGFYADGMRLHNWVYDINDTLVQVNWNIFTSKELKINYISNWVIDPDSSFMFKARIAEEKTNHGNCIFVSKIEEGMSKADVSEYNAEFYKIIKDKWEIKHFNSKLIRNGNRRIYLIDTDIIREGIHCKIFNACFSINNKIYFIHFSTDKVSDISGTIYLNILESCVIKGTRVVNPLIPYSYENVLID